VRGRVGGAVLDKRGEAMHRPSVPEDLDHPERLWARAATLAVVAAAVDDGDEFSWSD